jgi:hypothetical protein
MSASTHPASDPPRAMRSAFCAVVLQVPALAAMASMWSAQHPWSRHSSPTMRRTACSLVVNLQARCGGMGPEEASRRRRSKGLPPPWKNVQRRSMAACYDQIKGGVEVAATSK